MTEEEAKSKLCHRSITPNKATQAMNGSDCVASRCMAWIGLKTKDGEPKAGSCGLVRES